jgi:hypothetical protein
MTVVHERCIRLNAVTVGRKQRFRLNRQRVDLSIVRIAIESVDRHAGTRYLYSK